MAFTVEDGTGLANSNAYVSLVEFKAYQDDRGFSYAGKSDTEIQQAIVRATVYMGAKYRTRWKGIRVKTTQALDWPRSGVLTDDARYPDPAYRPALWPDLTYLVPEDVVPNDIKSACTMLAARELAVPGELSQVFERGGAVVATSASAGPASVSTTYAAGAPAATVYASVDGVLEVYLAGAKGLVPIVRG